MAELRKVHMGWHFRTFRLAVLLALAMLAAPLVFDASAEGCGPQETSPIDPGQIEPVDVTAPSSYEPVPNPGAPSDRAIIQKTVGDYKVRFYGTLLTNLSVSDSRQVGSDVPLWPIPGDDLVTESNGTTRRAGVAGETNFTLRQSVLGLEFHQSGGRLEGWSPGGLVEMDFFGSRPVDVGLIPSSQVLNAPRFRRGYFQMQRGTWRILVGQEQAIIAPLDPVSYSHVAEPLGASAGNLWGWLPQFRVENSRTAGSMTALFQAGVLWPSFRDPVLGDLNEAYGGAVPNSSAGLKVRRHQPFYQARVALSRPKVGGVTTLGLGVHYGREELGATQTFDSWAVAADYTIPLLSRLTLRGEVFAGSNLSAFDGGIIQGISAQPDEPPFTAFRPVHDTGAWVELGAPITSDNRNLLYAGAGLDDPRDRDLLPAAPRSKSSFFWASYLHRLGQGFTVALEWSYWDFKYREFSPAGAPEETGVPGRGNVFNLALAYQF